MKAPEKAMAGKTADGSIKWQLCYDMTARTWWMVSLVLFFFSSLPTYFLPYLMAKTYDQVTPPSELFVALLMRLALQIFQKLSRQHSKTILSLKYHE